MHPTISLPNRESDKINKTHTYIYFNKVVAGVDAMISKQQFVTRYYKKNKSERSADLEEFIKSQFKAYTKISDSAQSNGKQDTALVLRGGSPQEVISIIESFRKSKLNLPF